LRELQRHWIQGRLAVYEVMVMHEALKELIIKGVSSMELKREAVKLGMSTLRMSALQKVRDGLTTSMKPFVSPIRIKDLVPCSPWGSSAAQPKIHRSGIGVW